MVQLMFRDPTPFAILCQGKMPKPENVSKHVQTNRCMGSSLVFRYAFAVNLYLDPSTPPANGGSDCDLWTSDCDFGALGAGSYSLMILGWKPSRRSLLDLKRWWLIDPLASWSAAKMENIFFVCIDMLHKNRRTIIICFVIKMMIYVYCVCVIADSSWSRLQLPETIIWREYGARARALRGPRLASELKSSPLAPRSWEILGREYESQSSLANSTWFLKTGNPWKPLYLEEEPWFPVTLPLYKQTTELRRRWLKWPEPRGLWRFWTKNGVCDMCNPTSGLARRVWRSLERIVCPSPAQVERMKIKWNEWGEE